MKAYLETIVITVNSVGDRHSSLFNTVLEFENQEKYIMFKDQVDEYERCPGFEVYRTLMPIY